MRNSIKNILVEMRIWQWSKNILVFAPLIFGESFFNRVLAIDSVKAFSAFCFASSSVYVLNDTFDIKLDKMHPKKKERPIASGKLSLNAGYFLSILLFLLSLGFAFWANKGLLILILLYALGNIAYSRIFKHVAVADIVIVAIFYLLRVYAGAIAISVPVSGWLFLTTFFLSLFVITGKRKSELVACLNLPIKTRRVLEEYNEKFLDGTLVMSITLAVAFYSLYAITVHDGIFSASIIFVLYAVLRYLFLIYVKSVGEEPEKLLFKDKSLLASGIAFGIFLLVVIYFPAMGKLL